MDPTPVIFDCDGLFTRYGVPLQPADRRRRYGHSLQRLGHTLAELLDHPVPAGMLASWKTP